MSKKASKTNEELVHEWLKAPPSDIDPEHSIYWDYWSEKGKLGDELEALDGLGSEGLTEEHLRRKRKLREGLGELEERTQKAISELKHQRTPRLTKEQVEVAYKERVKDWPKDKTPPTPVEDQIWCREELKISRDRMRELRKAHAPKTWTAKGRRGK